MRPALYLSVSHPCHQDYLLFAQPFSPLYPSIRLLLPRIQSLYQTLKSSSFLSSLPFLPFYLTPRLFFFLSLPSFFVCPFPFLSSPFLPFPLIFPHLFSAYLPSSFTLISLSLHLLFSLSSFLSPSHFLSPVAFLSYLSFFPSSLFFLPNSLALLHLFTLNYQIIYKNKKIHLNLRGSFMSHASVPMS